MSAAARSVCYFGFYLYITGLTLIFVPNILLSTLHIPETNEVWIRVVGVLAFCLGYYYHRMGLINHHPFFLLTVHARVLVCIAFGAFVLLKYVSPMLAGFGLIDLAGAMWTYLAMKKQK